MHSLQAAKLRCALLTYRVAIARSGSSSAGLPAPQISYLSKEMEAAIPKEQVFHFPQIGLRERVGHGRGGTPLYIDNLMFPYPAIRYREWDAAYEQLRQKEKGDWKSLSMEDKKNLYRHSYRYTFSETAASTGRWKFNIGVFLVVVSVASWTLVFLKKAFGPTLPSSYDEEWMMRSMWKQIMIGHNPVEGVSSKWDYENNRWKE